MSSDAYLEDALLQLRKLRRLADQALDQLTDEQLFIRLDTAGNPIALVMKHLAGNMRSRWTEFLTTDGEKPDRQRDREFELEDGDTAESLRSRWIAGWRCVLEAVGSLRAEDLGRTVTIRGEPHTVLQAIQRQLTHYAYHVGQIVLIARHLAGERWRWLSIPLGASRDHEVAGDGSLYLTDDEQRTDPR
jgi:hypothetical protein